ncbi:hypothetical protein AB1L88_02020 [Tautonia sp. JC769]|uniref:hypothetical protein n=1 Tax=Tautonia sp. JC769 TaxID=3232135 RepID=UPI003459E01E
MRLIGVLIIMLAIPAVESSAQGFLHKFHRKPEHSIPTHPGAITVRDLAKLIDDLDKELFDEGKIAVKSPDVYGQNRLTNHRQEFEDEMDKELDQFQLRLQSFQRRADAASLMSSSILRAGIGTKTTTVEDSENVQLVEPPSSPTNPTGNFLANSIFTRDAEGGGISATGFLTPSSLTNFIGENATLGSSLAGFDQPGIGLEPTVVLDQKKRYLDHLNQIRRLNEGDDLVDLPGYGLYLVRMPVSLLPGPDSRRGKGAVVTVNATQHLTPDILPTTFGNVVILDTAYQLTDVLNSLLQEIESDELKKKQTEESEEEALTGSTRTAPSADSRDVRASQIRAAQASVDPGSSAPTGILSPSEVEDIYGIDNLLVLVDYLKTERDHLFPHDPSTFSSLFRDLRYAHRYMREQAIRGNPLFQPDVFENIGGLVLARDYGALQVHRQSWLKALRSSRNVTEERTAEKQFSLVIDVLAYGLMVQSVLIDRQLKHDMMVVAQRAGLACDTLDHFTFHAFDPSLEEREAFNTYVAQKWPIHVFSLDPAVEQQNELDLYSIRTQLQLAFALGVATGQIEFENLTSYARLLERDLATIGLNRTAVGFGAGDTTFGWRFYPRIQTPPTESNPQRFLNTLLFNGPPPNYDLKTRRIEPGPRECVALIVMPNFIPGVRFTTTANWFDLAGMLADQELDTVDMVDLSRKVQIARNGLPNVIDSHLYRPEELARLDDRITQLEALLPMQTHYSKLPFEGDLSGSEIFSSDSSKLAPRLLAWYGEPPIHGNPSSIFILGTNFGIVDMEVIAGGVTIPGAGDLISRNVLRITIPPEAMPIRTKYGVQAFDIHVATPNGISNHLIVEINPESAPPPFTPPIGFKLETTDLTITGKLDENENLVPDSVGASNPIRIDLVPLVSDPPTTVKVTFTYPFDPKKGLLFPSITATAQFDSSKGDYVISGNELEAWTRKLFEQLKESKLWTPEQSVPGLDSTKIVVSGLGTEKELSTPLKVKTLFTITPKKTTAVGSPTKPLATLEGEGVDGPGRSPVPLPASLAGLPPLPGQPIPATGRAEDIPPPRIGRREDAPRDEGVSRSSWLGRLIPRDR